MDRSMEEQQHQPRLESFLQLGDTPRPRADEVAKTFKRRNIDLQKSIQLLDDAVSPSVIRPSRTTRGSLRHSSYTPSRLESQFDHDMSSMFMFTPAKQTLRTPGEAVDSPRFQANTSLRERGTGLGGNETTLDAEFDLTEDVTKSNLTFLAVEDPGQKASSGLFEEFMVMLKRNGSSHQVLDLLMDYENSCNALVNKLKKLSKGVTRNHPKLWRTMEILDLLKWERETWQLVRSLYKDRLDSETKDEVMEGTAEGEELQGEKPTVWALSEKNIANSLFERDSIVRQSQLVIDWLEMCAADNMDAYYENIKFFVDQPVYWENTLHQLQKSKQGLKSSMDRPVISEMDPDAPNRQKRSLDDLDREDERLLLQTLFLLLRAGQLEKAQEICETCGQPWRSATLEGWRLLHDPNFYSLSSDTAISPVQGNPYRDVWKAVCWRMATEPSFDQFECAVYATLSGNLQGLLPVCNSWMDYLWAYYKVMVDIKVEQELRLHHNINRDLDSLPQEFWGKMMEPHDIFKEISASVEEKIRQQSDNQYHLIQKFIILGDVPGLIEVMYSWIQQDASHLPQHLLRLMAHIILFLRTIGHDTKEDLCEAILEAYVEDLIKNSHKGLVAHYVATLRSPAQVQWYASFLEGIGDQEERRECLQWAGEEGLDVAAVTKSVVERIRAREVTSVPLEHSLAADLTVTKEDLAKIDAIDWLVFDEAHRPEAVKQANAIMRSFIVVKKHVAARQAFEKLPADTIDIVYRLWHQKTGALELPARDTNAIREYMCMKAYLDAVESFNDWFNLYHQGQPSKPSGLEGASSFTDRVAMEHKMKHYRMEQERWMHNLLQQTRATRDRIYNVLLFADGGWLRDMVEDPEADEGRQHQLTQLRKLHLPALCLNLHNMLHSSGLFTEAVQIADVLASEQHQLYQEFDTESLQHLLVQIGRSSRCLLDENKDPLGYELV